MTDRPRGTPLPEFTPPPRPADGPLSGRYVRLERLGPQHGAALFEAFDGADEMWDYMPLGPYSRAELDALLADFAVSADPFFFAICDAGTGAASGFCSYLRIAPEDGRIELGYVALSPRLQRTRAATEAFCLLIGWAFDTGYRRFEWKCNALNLPSRRAAIRLGLSYEGVFRQHSVVKGRNRDTAWFAAIDSEWPQLKAAYAAWLDSRNFDEAGRQRQSLSVLTAPVIVAHDPALSEG